MQNKIVKFLIEVWESPILRIILIALCLLLFMLQLWNLKLFGTNFNYDLAGNLSSWFTGILTLFIVCMAAITIRNDKLKFETEQERRKAEKLIEEEKHIKTLKAVEREKCGKIYPWMQPKRDHSNRVVAVECHFENQTSVPIYVWKLLIEGKTICLSSIDRGPIVPGHSIIFLKDSEWIELFVENSAIKVSIEFDARNNEKLVRNFEGKLTVIEES